MKRYSDMMDTNNGIKVELSGVVKDFNDNEYDCVVSVNAYIKVDSDKMAKTDISIEFGVGRIVELDIDENIKNDTNFKLRKVISINNESIEKNIIDNISKWFELPSNNINIEYCEEEIVHSV
jgi:hypothetical protein